MQFRNKFYTIEDGDSMIKVKKKRKIRIGRVLLLLIGCILAVCLLFGGFLAIKNLFHHEIIAKEYALGTENKLEDDKIDHVVYAQESEDREEDDVFAIHIPKFTNEEANQKVDAFVVEMKAKKQRVTYIDYESFSAFGQYKSYILNAQLYADMDGLNPINQTEQVQLIFHFDQENLINLDDCLRTREILRLAKDNNCDEADITLKKITEEGLILDVNGSEKEYSYKDHQTSFIMDNTNIPSVLKYPKISVEKREIDPNKPMIAFTFDDGPAPGNTERILAALKKVDGRATFFELGNLMEVYPETVRAVVESGSEVGCHSYDHTFEWMSTYTAEKAAEDIKSVEDIFFSLTGNDMRLFRPPFGAGVKSLKDSIVEKIVLWDVDTRDWESRNTQSVIEMCKKYTYDGAVVLFHDIHATTIPAVEELIQYYGSLGYQFVTVSELIEAKGK